MYNYGLVKFMEAKKLKSNECINSFLLSENITEFTAKNHNKVNNYIQNNWNKFSSYCDKMIKNNQISGKAVKLNTYYDEKAEEKRIYNQELSLLSKKELTLYNKTFKVKSHRCDSYFSVNKITVPKQLEGICRAYKFLPKIQLIIDNNLQEDLINYCNQTTNK